MSSPRSDEIARLAQLLYQQLEMHDDGTCACVSLLACDAAKLAEIDAALRASQGGRQGFFELAAEASAPSEGVPDISGEPEIIKRPDFLRAEEPKPSPEVSSPPQEPTGDSSTIAPEEDR